MILVESWQIHIMTTIFTQNDFLHTWPFWVKDWSGEAETLFTYLFRINEMLLYKVFGNFVLLCHVNVVYSFYSSGFEIFILLLIYWSILWLEVNCMNRSLYPIQDEIIISYCSIVKWFFLWCCACVCIMYLPFFSNRIFYWTSKYIPITQNNEQRRIKGG